MIEEMLKKRAVHFDFRKKQWALRRHYISSFDWKCQLA